MVTGASAGPRASASHPDVRQVVARAAPAGLMRAWAPGFSSADVTFTKDKQLVCRHSQATCTRPRTSSRFRRWSPSARCRSFSPTRPRASRRRPHALAGRVQAALRQDGRLQLERDHPEEYQHGTPSWRTDLYATCGTVLSHDEYIDQGEVRLAGIDIRGGEAAVGLSSRARVVQEHGHRVSVYRKDQVDPPVAVEVARGQPVDVRAASGGIVQLQVGDNAPGRAR